MLEIVPILSTKSYFNLVSIYKNMVLYRDLIAYCIKGMMWYYEWIGVKIQHIWIFGENVLSLTGQGLLSLGIKGINISIEDPLVSRTKTRTLVKKEFENIKYTCVTSLTVS